MNNREKFEQDITTLISQLTIGVGKEVENKLNMLKDWLLKFSNGKCWFSEAKDTFSHMDVEHFRPKKSAKDLNGVEREGYWWLTFDWHNYRICGNVGNRKKGTFFPLSPGCTPATCNTRQLDSR